MNALGRMSLATVLLGFWLRFRGLDGRLLGVPRGCQALGVLPRWVVHRTGRDRQRALQFELFQRWPRPMTRSRADPLAFRERGAVFVPSQKFSSGSRSSNSRGVDRIVPAAERIPSLDSSCRWPRRVPDCPVFHRQPCPSPRPGRVRTASRRNAGRVRCSRPGRSTDPVRVRRPGQRMGARSHLCRRQRA